MDIQRAKEEIKRAVQAYLATDDIGRPLIPAVRQRPILLMGPPGVGKTQIMEQIAQECDIALVAYTITTTRARAPSACRSSGSGTTAGAPAA
mgnify:CR=1 FL=1